MAVKSRLGAQHARLAMEQFFDTATWRLYFAAADYDPFGFDQWAIFDWTWQNSTFDYKYGDIIQPTTPNDHFYVCVQGSATGGASRQTGAIEPTWPTDGTTVVDNEVIWKDAGTYPPHFQNTAFSVGWGGVGYSDTFRTGFCPATQWAPGASYTQQVDYVHPVTNDGKVYVCSKSGTSGGGEPAWFDGGPITDNTVEWHAVEYNAGAWAMPTSSAYDFRNGLVIASGTGFGFASGWLGIDYVFNHLTVGQISGLDISGWAGLYLKWGFLVAGSAGVQTGPGTFIDWIDNMIVAEFDLDDTKPAGVLINASDTLNLRFPSPSGTNQGVIVEFDQSNF